MSFWNKDILKNVIVQIYHGKTAMGSGCIMPSVEAGQFYCLTAYHCVDGEDIQLFLMEDGKKSMRLEYSPPIIAKEDLDAAILRVKYPPEQYPEKFFPGKANGTYHEGGLVGYSGTRGGDLACYDAHLNSFDTSTLTMNLTNAIVIKTDVQGQIAGASGGGCLVEEENAEYKLMGIETGLVDTEQSFSEIHGLQLSVFNNMLCSSNLPLLAYPKYHYASMFPSMRSISARQKEHSDYAVWTNTEGSKNLLADIQDFLLSPLSSKEGRALLLCGFSGIGKTRTVLQACAENSALSNVLFFDGFGAFNSAFESKLSTYVQTVSDEPVYLIVDDIEIDQWLNFERIAKQYSNIRAIAIAEMGEVDSRSDLPLMRMIPHGEEDVIQIILNVHPTMNKEDARAIHKLSDNDLRFALLIASAYERAESRSAWEIQRLSSGDPSVGQIVDKIMNNVVDPSHVQAVKILSLFVNCGYNSGPLVELKFLAKYFRISELVLVRAIEFCADHHLGIKRGSYFELSPRAWARLLFSKYHVELICDYPAFLDQIPTNDMRKQFFLRAHECGQKVWEEVRGALVPWFRGKYGNAELAVFPRTLGGESVRLSEGDPEEIMTYVEFVPEDGLLWMKHLIDNTDDALLDKFSGFSGRRAFVWTCEHLACFQEYFDICEQILFRLSQHESEYGISNNSRGVWSELFGLWIANTEKPFKDRFRLLMRRMCDHKDGQDTSMFDAAIAAALAWSCTRLLPPKMVGGRLTPESWATSHIRRQDDFSETQKWLLSTLQSSFGALPRVMRKIVFDRLKQRIYEYTAGGFSQEYRQALEVYAPEPEQRMDIVVAIDAQFERQKILQGQQWKDDLENTPWATFMAQWRESLATSDFTSRLKVTLSKNIYTQKEKRLAEIAQLAKELVAENDPASMLEQLLLLSGLDSYALVRFACMVGEADTAHRLLPVIRRKFLEGNDSFPENYLCGVCDREQGLPEFVRVILNSAVHSNPKGVLHISIVYDVSDEGRKRVCALLKKSIVDNFVLGFSEERWTNILSLEQMEDILSLLLETKTNDGIYGYFYIGREWLRSAPGSNLEDFLFQRTADLPIELLQRFSYQFIPLMEQMPERLLRECLLLVVRSIDYSTWIKYQTDQVRFIQKYADGLYAKDIAYAVCDCIKGQFNRMRYVPSYALLVSLLPAELVLQWIEIDELDRVEIIAYHLPAPSLKKFFIPEVTLLILEQYGENERAFHRFLSGIHAYEAYTLDDVVENSEKTFAILALYEDHPLMAIRRWAEFEKKRVIEDITEKQRLDAIHDRFRDD